jgi:hypothetical protein
LSGRFAVGRSDQENAEAHNSELTEPRKATHKMRVDNTTRDELVQAVAGKLAALCNEHSTSLEGMGTVLTALAMTSVKACKAYGIHPSQFVAYFEQLYGSSPPPAVLPVMEGSES